jgi:histidinol dehydrogenase
MVHPAIRYVAHLLGFTKVYAAGGAQAIAAMAYGTESIPKVDKIFGPGNSYVTLAKQLVQEVGVAIDMPAGPSEVLVIADAQSNPDFVAADLLSQAEHGADSQVVLVVSDVAGEASTFVKNTQEAIDRQLAALPRKEVAAKALSESRIIRFKTDEEAISFSNAYAPEHLILANTSAEALSEKVSQAGSVFIGAYSCESAGDYASGTNHTLPTNGYARNYSGVSLDSFLKKITFQKLTAEGLQNLGPTIEIMAEAEQLQAHKNAVTIRLNALKDV